MNLASQYFVAAQSVIGPHSFLRCASACFAKFILASTGSEERQPFSFWHQNGVFRSALEFRQFQAMNANEHPAYPSIEMGELTVRP